MYGLHFHCGSGQHGSSAFKEAIEVSGKLMQVGKQCGHRMKLLDLGGGFPAAQLSDAQVQVLNGTREQGYRVVAEPGRHFSQETCSLALRIIGKRQKMAKTCYHVNDGLLNNIQAYTTVSTSFSWTESPSRTTLTSFTPPPMKPALQKCPKLINFPLFLDKPVMEPT